MKTSWYQRKIVPRLLNSEMNSEELEKIRRTVLSNAAGEVLEIGVGPGYSLPLYKNVLKVYALEPSKELIEIAKTRAGASSFPIQFIHSEAEAIPLLDNSVDTVVSTWTLCSVRDSRKVLQEIMRVLRPNGHFVFIEHGASPIIGLRLLQKILTPITRNFTGNCHYDREIERLIREAGFKFQEIDHPAERFKPLIYNYKGLATKI